MAEPEIRFDDGAAYEQMMGKWSRLAGAVFLDWLAPDPGMRWLDVGCGNGAFTELVIERCAPASIDGIDPSEGQLNFARKRQGAIQARFHRGDAQALPFSDASFDAAVMALVIFFVPDPAKGVAEMVRVVRAGGSVSAYAWDVLNGGFPFEPIQAEMRAAGLKTMAPPSVEASRIESMRALWTKVGLVGLETRQITVERRFSGFDELWNAILLGASLKQTLAAAPPDVLEALKTRLRARLPAAADGSITYASRANAIKGRVPG